MSGSNALYSNKIGTNNAAFGSNALYSNTKGSSNIALGMNAGKNLTIGSNNIDIGHSGMEGEAETIRLGTPGVQERTFIAGIRGVTVSSGAMVLISSSGQLGVLTSSQRYKEDIQPMGDASAALLNLKPVSFRYKEADEHGRKPVQFGLIAEDVAKTMPELVVFDEAGKPETVAYQSLSSLLLNEFQKEHRQRRADLARYDEKLAAIKSEAELSIAHMREQMARRDQELATLHSDLAQMRQTMRQLVAAQRSDASLAQATQ